MFVGRLELQPFKGKVFGQASFLKLGGDVLNSRDEAGGKYLAIEQLAGKQRRFSLAVYPAQRG